MAQYVKNNINYHGARSKTRVENTEATRGKSKKGKKKYETGYTQHNSENTKNSWDVPFGKNQSGKSSNNMVWEECSNNSSAWSNGWETKSQNKNRDQDDCWGNVEYRPNKETKTTWNDIEQDFPPMGSEARAPQRNVWKEREKKYQEIKSMEPSNEDEEEKMIRIALELSKAEAQNAVLNLDIRKRIEDEYQLQEQMLINNPSEFQAFILPEESAGATAWENSSTEPAPVAPGEYWCLDEYASAVKSSPAGGRGNNSNNYSSKTTSANKWDESAWDDEVDNDKDVISYETNYSSSNKWDDHTWDKDTASNNVTYQKNHSSKTASSGKWDKGGWEDVTSDTNNLEQLSFKKETNNSTKKYVGKNDTSSSVSKAIKMFGGWGSSTSTGYNVTSVSNNNSEKSKSYNKVQSEKIEQKAVCEQGQVNMSSAINKSSKSLEQNTLINSENTSSNSKDEFKLPSEPKLLDPNKNIDFIQKNRDEVIEVKNVKSCNLSDSMKNCMIVAESESVHNKDLPDNYLSETQSGSTTNEKLLEADKCSSKPDNFVSADLKPGNTIIIDTHDNRDYYLSDENLGVINSSSVSHGLNNLEGDIDIESTLKIDSFESISNVRLNTSPIPFIKPPKPASTSLTENIRPPIQNVTFESGEPIKFQDSPQMMDYNIEPPKPAPNHHLPDAVESNPYPSFPTPAPTNVLPIPINPMMFGLMNPNMMPGMNPFLMQQMLMLNYPFMASQLQAMEMYYRSLGIITPSPHILPNQMPTMLTPSFGNSSEEEKGFGNLNENSFPNSFNNPLSASDNASIHRPTYPSYDMQSFQENDNPSSTAPVINSDIVFQEPTQSLKEPDDVVDSWLSYLSNDDQSCDKQDALIPPPVLPTIKVPSELNIESSPGHNIGANPSNSVVKISGYSSGSACNNSVNDAGDSECIGWGDFDVKSSTNSKSDLWNDELDGWGDNITTKSMTNPSNFSTTRKNTNRQPLRQPNLSRYKK